MIGQTVGKYRVEERIGRGGMGTVYRAVDETLRREVAIKVLNSELNDPEVAKRFRAEAITVARLNHAGIATVYELFEHDGQWLMVMEFVRGETLERLIERAGPLSAERAADLCMQALAALTHAHGLGVVHRDLKPANLMLTEAGAVKIMDFGIARVSGSEHLTSAGFMMGTPAYMAPEQVLGHEVDARTDLYAMGVVLYRLTTAKLPFKGETPFALAQSQVNDPPTPIRTAREGLPAWLEQVLFRALAKAPGDRFQTALEFREVLKRCLAGLPIDPQFDAMAPTGMIRTPVGLPTGALGMSPPGSSGAIAAPPGTAGSPLGMTEAAVAPTGHHSTAGYQSTLPTMSVSTAQTMMAASTTGASPSAPTTMAPSPSGAMPMAAGGSGAIQASGAIPTGTGAMAQNPATGTVAAAPPKPAAGAKRTPNTMMIGIAAGVIVVAIAGWLMLRHGGAPPPAPVAVTPPAPTDASTQTAANAPTATGTNPGSTTPANPATVTPPGTAAAPNGGSSPASSTPPATQTATGTGAAANSTNPSATAPGSTTSPATGGSAAPGTTGTSPSAGARGATTTPGGAPGAPAATGARADAGRATTGRGNPADAADALIVFSDAKLLTFDGRKGKDQDVIIHFGGGQITVVPKKGGAAIVQVPYKRVAKATYAHAKDPKWDTSLFGLPDNPDIPGFMRGTRNWLVLQWKSDYVAMYLSDANVADVLQTFEARTGLKIDRPSDGGR